MNLKLCKKHPTKIARYRCFLCKTIICSECRINLAHHYFCSYKCYFIFTIKGLPKQLKHQQIRILFAIQLILFLLILWQMTISTNRDSAQNYQPADKNLQTLQILPAIRSYLNRYEHYYEKSELKKLGTLSEHHHNLKIPMKKGWLVNIWRNDEPVISEWAETDEEHLFSIPLDYGNNLIRLMVLNNRQEMVHGDQFSITYKNEQVELLRNSIEQGNQNNRRIALTFDAGSDSAHTNEILDILASHNLFCTMFLTGNFIKRYPYLVKRMVDKGHEIANHTFNHPHLTTYRSNQQHDLLPGINRQFIHEQLTKTDSIFYQVTGQHLKPYWRAPFGEYNTEILTWAAEAGFLHIRWTGAFDTHDWVIDEESDLYHTPEQLYKQIMQAEEDRPNGLNGVIVLMHLGSKRNENHVYEVLPRLIQTIKEKGYVPGCISDLLKEHTL